MAFNRFAAGRKVYIHGSYAPTRGPVKKKGYMQREIRRRQAKRAKRMSPQMAQAALRARLRRG
jgi:hypothetical protein